MLHCPGVLSRTCGCTPWSVPADRAGRPVRPGRGCVNQQTPDRGAGALGARLELVRSCNDPWTRPIWSGPARWRGSFALERWNAIWPAQEVPARSSR